MLEQEELEMIGASISVYTGNMIMRQGFDRIKRTRDKTVFVNEYKNGLDTTILTQVHFKTNTIQVFFKLSSNVQMTQQEKERSNIGYSSLFNDIISDIKIQQQNGEFNHLRTQFEVEHFIDNLQ